MSTTSTRTLVRDALAKGFENLKRAGTGRVKDFAISLRWIHEQESIQSNTVCIVTTDETRTAQTLTHDAYDLQATVVLYVNDPTDPRAMLDAMIEDAIETVWLVAPSLKEWAWNFTLSEITTDDATKAAGPWAQALLRWAVSHRRMRATV